LFYTPLGSARAIAYRQEITRELEDASLRAAFDGFSNAIFGLKNIMADIMDSLLSGNKLYDNYITRGRVMDCADWYSFEVNRLAGALRGRELRSEGLRSFAEYLFAYIDSESFKILGERVKKLREAFSKIEFCMFLSGSTKGLSNGVLRVNVQKYDGQPSHADELLRCFEKFKQGETSGYERSLPEIPGHPEVESRLLDILSALFTEEYGDLNDFCRKHIGFVDNILSRFSREVQFYLGWHESMEDTRRHGLDFCYPNITESKEHIYAYDCYDLALAKTKETGIVTNDFEIKAPERIVVITGPNQGGKTTFSRAFGQAHYFACLGLSVPAREASLFVFDKILTHHGREEDVTQENGQLRDDLIRLRELLSKATDRSIILVNEILASTTLSDAMLLGGYMMDTFAKLGAIVLCVTFLDELSRHGEETFSMAGIINEEDPSKRTYKIVRKSPSGLAYAEHIANKYGLSYEKLCGRIAK
jgi:dsDNA-specific endonuclease/ATPase MutS2